MVLTVTLALLGAAAVVAVALAVGRAAARSATQEADAKLAAALERQAQELVSRLGFEREHTVGAAADMAARMAGEKLGDTLATGGKHLELRAEAFDQKVAGIDQQLQRMGDLMAGLKQEGATQHGQLITNLRAATASTQALTETAQHLREALASPKARGQWGERMADDVLRTAGMVEGITYRKQTGIAGGSIPDITFLLPGGRHLHMDVKFPVDNYLRHLEAGSERDRETTAKAFLRDVRNRVKELSGRDYIKADDTLDEVLLFIPNESVWAFIHEQDPQLIDIAMGQKVVLCSPVSLFAVLAVIRQAVDQTRLARTSDEILQCLSAFRHQWTKYADAVDNVEKRFSATQKCLDELTGTRRRQLERQLDRIDDLRSQRGLPEAPAGLGDGEGEVLRRAVGDIRPWGAAEAG
ncbi:MAG: DNA recombination protein RmuC [Acidimicrobiales bacterium]|nr:DNA recombination protein RmuC [Acidimicrobiales bacterium]